VVVAKDGPEFADAIISLLDSPERRAAIGSAGRAFVERHHDWTRIAADLETLYVGVLADRRATVAPTPEADPAVLGPLLSADSGHSRVH
jgi:hypothetical protein